MGQSVSSIKNYTAKIETKDEKTFEMFYHSLVEHFILLRQVINHPEIRLDYFIQDYSQRMTKGQMKTEDQQSIIPWEIEWIWHVHRLHPLIYINDCNQQLEDGLVDKKTSKLILYQNKKGQSKIIFPSNISDSIFNPSIDLRNAIIRQNDFLQKFEKHFLYSFNLKKVNELKFNNFVQNDVSFLKLADKNEVIVPTFEIDLICHTHIRYPLHYQQFSLTLFGFILDHDDSIE